MDPQCKIRQWILELQRCIAIRMKLQGREFKTKIPTRNHTCQYASFARRGLWNCNVYFRDLLVVLVVLSCSHGYGSSFQERFMGISRRWMGAIWICLADRFELGQSEQHRVLFLPAAQWNLV